MTFRRPRCAIPSTTWRAPASAPRAIASSSIGTSASTPSIEKRFTLTYARPRNRSSASTAVSRSSKRLLLVGGQRLRCLARFDRRAEPLPLGLVADVLELVAEARAVELAQAAHEIRRRFRARISRARPPARRRDPIPRSRGTRARARLRRVASTPADRSARPDGRSVRSRRRVRRRRPSCAECSRRTCRRPARLRRALDFRRNEKTGAKIRRRTRGRDDRRHRARRCSRR